MSDIVQCPYEGCGSLKCKRHGNFPSAGAGGSRERYKCRDCRRTFSTATTDPLRYGKIPPAGREKMDEAIASGMSGRAIERELGYRHETLAWHRERTRVPASS